MELIKEKKKEIAEFCIAVLIILEVVLLLSPIFAHIKGCYYGESYSIRFTRDTYDVEGKKGFYTFETVSLPDNAGISAITLDSGKLFGKNSAFVMRDYRSGETFVSGRAVFYQILIVAFFCICVYFAFIQRDKPIKKEAKDDDDWNTDLLKG
ncbi:MAG: hypothetical protein J6K29_12660 [Clostridia bacterium]|nr:hypothetical protein [Clostridia bacterium]MBP3667886.1 hypothetical protein [Clostridia bacterium]